MNEKEIFLTQDIYNAAALLSKGIELIDINKNDPKKVIFVFPHSKVISQIIEDYWNNKLTVDAKTILDSLKNLKSRIYSAI